MPENTLYIPEMAVDRLSCHILRHEGTPHEGDTPHSGRYPWGSGDAAFQRAKDFMSMVEKRKAEGHRTTRELAESMGMTTREFTAKHGYCNELIKNEKAMRYQTLAEQGLTIAQIAEKTGEPQSTVRSRLESYYKRRENLVSSTRNMLHDKFNEYSYIDVGEGVATSLGISEHRLASAVQALVDDGYVLHTFRVQQGGAAGQTTKVRVLCKPGTTLKDVRDHQDAIGVLDVHYESPQSTEYQKPRPVENFPSSRVGVRYAEQGGSAKDGIIELRPGVEGLSLGNSRYAQVRISVDGTHFIKGVAMYSDDLPKGVDILFNTNKKEGTPLISKDGSSEVLKPMKFPDNPNNPFGAAIKAGGQRGYLNIVNEEGDWSRWSKTLASQMLSKQPTKLVRQQLDLARQVKAVEFEEIKSITNNSLKQKMLQEFADKCDSVAVDLVAHSMPGQASYALLPLTDIKPKDIYAPKYENGTSVVLIRYPHAGTFEIPRLRVNNNNPQGVKLLGDARDAVGIHPDVAKQLSGADYDGDTVLVIPDNTGRIVNTPAIKSLQEFDPGQYSAEGRKKFVPMTDQQRNREMGKVSNLINDMTYANAPQEDIVRAVKHSMVVIDAPKHKYDWKQSERDFRIQELRDKYQPKLDENGNVLIGKNDKPKPGGGASSITSKASSPTYVPRTKTTYSKLGINPDTGELIQRPSDRRGVVKRPLMSVTKDANDLVSSYRHPTELAYADYANAMKKMANDARLEFLRTPSSAKSKEASATYAAEVASLNKKVSEAVSRQPVERKAQLIADYKARLVAEDMGLTPAQKQKYQGRYLVEARAQLGGSRQKFKITDNEWAAIQAGAVGPSTLRKVFRYTDQDALKERALPKSVKGLTPTKIGLARSLISSGHTLKDVANQLGVSVSTLENAIY